MSWKRALEIFNPFKVARQLRDMFGHARKVAAANGLSVLGITTEQMLLYIRCNLNRAEYYKYRLYDPEMSWAEKKAFLPDRGAFRYFRTFTPARYDGCFRNKLAFKSIFGSLGLPVAKLLGIFCPTTGHTPNGEPLRNTEDIERWATEMRIQEFVIKPIESAQGQLVLPLRRKGDLFMGPSGHSFSCADLVEHMTDEENLKRAYPPPETPHRMFLFEERLRLHPELSMLARETLCTIRFLTLVDLQGEAEILGATLKIPLDDIGVDNPSRGALGVHVDLKTGTLGEGVFKRDISGARYREHLKSGVKFYGLRLPCWKETKEIALRAALAFPLARVVGWDIGITDRGPVVVEGEGSWAVEWPQLSARKGLLCGHFLETFEKLSAERKKRLQ